MTAGQVMTSDLVVVRPGTSLKDVADLLLRYGFSGVPVADETGVLVGIVADADMVPTAKRVPFSTVEAPALFSEFVDPRDPLEPYREARNYTAADVMRTGVQSVDVGDDFARVTEILADDEVRQVPVTRNGKLVGIITRKDVIRTARRTKNP